MKKTVVLISLILFYVINIINAQVLDRSKRPLPAPAKQVFIGKIDSFQLSNGLKVFVIENHKIPEITYSLIINNDPILEKENKGYIEFAGELLNKGTKNRSKDKLDEDIDFIGANIITSSNGIYASSLTKHNEKLLEIMSDIILNSNFTQEELDKLKKKKLSELAAEKDDPAQIANRINNLIVFGQDHPYGENITEETVTNITLDMCKNFYNTYFKPNIAYLAIVGDISIKEAKPLIIKYLSKWEKGNVPKHTYKTPLPPVNNKIILINRPNAVQSNIIISFPVNLIPGTKDVIKARVMNNILGGGTSRLFNNLREKHAYTYGAYSQLVPDKLIGYFQVAAEVRTSVTDSAIYQMFYELNRIREEKVGEDELNLYKNYLNGTFSLSLEQAQTIANFAINIERYNMPTDFYTNYLKNLAAVNRDDIIYTAKKYLKPENAYIIVVGNTSEFAEKLKRIMQITQIEYYDQNGKFIGFKPQSNELKEAASNITVENVFNKYLDAIGGAEKLNKVTTLTKKIQTKAKEVTLEIETSQKNNNKLLISAIVNNSPLQKQIFNINKAKAYSQMGDFDIKGKELEDLKYNAYIFPELYYKNITSKYNLAGIENINGKNAYKIELTLPSGNSITDYYDVETGYKIKNIDNKVITYFSDYKTFDNTGILLPSHISIDNEGQVFDFNVLTYEINKDINDNVFEIK